MSALMFVALLAASSPAEVDVLVVDDRGTRAQRIGVRVGDVESVTDGDGHALLHVTAGHHVLSLSLAEAWHDAGALSLDDGMHVDIVIQLDALHTRVLAADADRAMSDAADAPLRNAAHADALAPPPALTLHATVARDVVVTSLADGTAIAKARVFVRGVGAVGETDATGTLQVALPPEGGAVSVVAPGFAARVAQVAQVAGDATDSGVAQVRVALVPLSSELDEMTVRAPYLQGALSSATAERRTSKQVVEVLGAEQMSRAGDGDAAAALRRVTGLTVAQGRYAYVRGLGDRYSSTLVNGGVLPSPEPERRVVPLDLFPSSTLDSLVVQKSWSPELPGEFGGGSVQLRTRGIAPRRVLSLGASTGVVVGSTFGTGRLPHGGWLDAIGIDDGTRALPGDVQRASDDEPLAEGNALVGGGYSSSQLESFGEQMGRHYTPQELVVLPNTGLSGAWGERFSTMWGEVGFIAAGSWSQEFLRTQTRRDTLTTGGDGLVPTQQLLVASTTRSAGEGGVLALAWQPAAGQRMSAVTVLNQSADDEARVATGFNDEVGTDIRLTRLRWVQRTLAAQQLLGEHDLSWSPFGDVARDSAKLTWRAAYALALRGEPDNRVTRYDLVDGVWQLSDRTDGNQRLYSALLDHVVDVDVALRIPFIAFDGLTSSWKSGASANAKTRSVDTRRFKFVHKGPLANSADVRALSPEDALSPSFIGKDGFQLAEATRNTDNYEGNNATAGAFTLVELALREDLDVAAGARVEAAHTDVSTFELFRASAAPVLARLDALDVLPSLSTTWRPLDELQLRVAGSRTVVRPELRELSPAVFTDVAGGRARFGNPALVATTLTHVDARAEWALSPTENVSASLFAKHFDRPIEAVVTAGADQAITWANAEAAWLGGIELEGRVELPAAVDVDALRGLSVGGNLTLAASRVELGADQRGTLTSSERALQGQSPWVANVQLAWERDEPGTAVTVLYNVFGPRIAEVGALGMADTYEEPFHQLDVVVKQRLPGDLSLGLQASNLLDLPAQLTIGGFVVDSVTRGRAVSLSLSWTPPL